jgi:hypothetical protein
MLSVLFCLFCPALNFLFVVSLTLQLCLPLPYLTSPPVRRSYFNTSLTPTLHIQHTSTCITTAALVWPPAASPSRALAYRTGAALPFHHFLQLPDTFLSLSSIPHNHLTLTSISTPRLRFLVNASQSLAFQPVTYSLPPESHRIHSTFTDASQTSTRHFAKHTTSSRLIGNSTSTDPRMNVRSHISHRALCP